MPPKKRSKAYQSRSDDATTKTYLELSDGTSHKFWQIEVNDKSTIVQYGKIGTKGTTSEKKHKNSDAAYAFVVKQKNEKLKKGYEVCVKEDDVPSKKRPKTSRKGSDSATSKKLENKPTEFVWKDMTQKHDFRKFYSTYRWVNQKNDDIFYDDETDEFFGGYKLEDLSDLSASEMEAYREEHAEIIKKSKTMKAFALKNPRILFGINENFSGSMVSYHELSYGKETFYLLSCTLGLLGEPFGETNVLYDDKEEEILRLELSDITDGDMTFSKAIKWKSTALKKKFSTMMKAMKPLLCELHI